MTDSRDIPYAPPEMAVAYTCPTCGHRNRLDATPVEFDAEDRRDARETFGPNVDVSNFVGAPAEHECAGCERTISLRKPGGHQDVFDSQWND